MWVHLLSSANYYCHYFFIIFFLQYIYTVYIIIIVFNKYVWHCFRSLFCVVPICENHSTTSSVCHFHKQYAHWSNNILFVYLFAYLLISSANMEIDI